MADYFHGSKAKQPALASRALESRSGCHRRRSVDHQELAHSLCAFSRDRYSQRIFNRSD